MTQFVLPLGGGARDPDRDYLVTDCNAHAAALIGRWKEWPFRTAILVGPPRSGKSMLAGMFASAGHDALDDADRADQTGLFHRWNRAQSDGHVLLLTARRPVGEWGLTIPDLASRLGASQQIALGDPDDALAEALLRRHVATRGISIADRDVAYALARTDRSYAAIEALAETLDRLSLEKQRPISQKLVREALAVDGRHNPEEAGDTDG